MAPGGSVRTQGVTVSSNVKPQLTFFAAVVATVAAYGAESIEVDVGKCRSIADPSARLACYDAIALGAAEPARPGSATPAAAAPAANATAVQRFGLVDRAEPSEVQSIESQVSGDFYGWGPNERIRLDNGQVWQVVDGSSGSVGPSTRKVTVRRGALGSFYLDFEGLNASPRVRRIQ